MDQSEDSIPSGNAWQKQVERHCRLECDLRGELYQPIPDHVGGDGGLEGISTDGEGYQCYADQDTLNNKERLRKQKKKITTDLGKLQKNQAFWQAVLGQKKLRRWLLITPKVPDKEVLVHARRVAKRIRALNLPFIDPAFEAFVVSIDHFQRATEYFSKNSVSVIDFDPDEIQEAELEKVESTFVANTDRKLQQVKPNDSKDQIIAQRKKYLRWHLDSENVFNKLLAKDPELWERLKQFCAQETATVEFQSTVDDARPNQRLLQVQKELTAHLGRDFKMLGIATLNIVTRGRIASWLGLCPLEFITEDIA